MRTIDNYFKFNKGDIIVVGASSGPDSMALLSMLLEIREKYDLKLICCHVNHNVRRESAEEARYMEEFANKYNLIFETMKIEKYSDDNFENEARNIRYHYFDEIVHKYNANYLMTAHHGDDLVETILMRIVRGSNLNGYSGFKKVVDMGSYMIVRPLIYFTKQELIDYDNKHHIKFYIDSSNNNLSYTRNRYRKKVLPFLKREDKNVHLKFLKFSETINDANNFVIKERDKALNNVYKDGNILIDEFLKVDPFLQKEILYYLMEKYYRDDLILINDKHINLILSLINSSKSNGRVSLPNEIIGVKSYNNFRLEEVTKSVTEYEIEVSRYAKLPNHHTITRVEDDDLGNSNNVCRLLSTDVSLPLIVRTRKFGDKIKLKGNGGTKKIKDIFINEKIPVEDRDIWPIVVDSRDNVVWIPGLKKSKFDKKKSEKYDIILKYN